jgi:hypothetical protein
MPKEAKVVAITAIGVFIGFGVWQIANAYIPGFVTGLFGG